MTTAAIIDFDAQTISAPDDWTLREVYSDVKRQFVYDKTGELVRHRFPFTITGCKVELDWPWRFIWT